MKSCRSVFWRLKPPCREPGAWSVTNNILEKMHQNWNLFVFRDVYYTLADGKESLVLHPPESRGTKDSQHHLGQSLYSIL